MGSNAAIGGTTGGLIGALGGVLAGAFLGPVGMAIGGIVGGAVGGTSGGMQGQAVDDQIAAQDKAYEQAKAQASVQQQANYKQAVAALQIASRGIATQAATKARYEREETDSAAFKKKHTPTEVATKSRAEAIANVSLVFAGLRNERNYGKTV
ncbi:MAG: hypothetical protein HY543_00870 [Deltaproteobacteria bacterium]|nr:hypothetical protein [Deltaproteobacteria bacterium]